MVDTIRNKIAGLPRKVKKLLLIFSDILALLLSLSFLVLLQDIPMHIRFDSQLLFATVFQVLGSAAIFLALGLYRAVLRFIRSKVVTILIVSAMLSSSLLAITAKNILFQLSFSDLLNYFIALLFFIGMPRLFFQKILNPNKVKEKQAIVIYGAGESGRQLLLSIADSPEYYPVSFVDDDASLHDTQILNMNVIDPLSLEKFASTNKVDKVLLAMPSATRQQRTRILQKLESLSLPVQTIPGMFDIVSGNLKINDFQDVEVDDLLGRDSVPPRDELLMNNIKDKVVLVTGAGGSIGSELCRQIILLKPKELLLIEVSEFGLYSIDKELNELAKARKINVKVKPFLASVQNSNRLRNILRTIKVDTLYHAAAYKHVPMVEYNVVEGVRNNIFGTYHTAKAAVQYGVSTFILVSTDKAVRPTNVMGATKRMAELVLQALAKENKTINFSMVRFGNVLGSSGSVVPVFKKQIKEGGPVTVTHPDIIRYFMTIPEAALLVIQAGAMSKGGDVFVLDMGEPVKIAELATKMIRLMGLELKDETSPHGDIEIEYTGLRPGEKLYEELLIGDNVEGTEHPKIMTAKEISLTWSQMEKILERLDSACSEFDQKTIRNILLNAPTGFSPTDGICDLTWGVSDKNSENIVSFTKTN